MPKNKFSWDKIINNDKIVLLFSIFIALVFWISMTNAKTDDNHTWKIENVPITVEYSTGAVEAGYKVFDTDKSTVAVSISGNSLTVRQIKADNIEVVAAITENVKEGENTITLSGRKKNFLMSDFTIVSIDPGTLSAYIGVAKEKTFEIESAISVNLEDNYYARRPVLDGETVTVSGPAEIIDKIAKVSAEYSFETPINETKDFVAPIVLYDEHGERIESEYISISKESVGVKLTVLWKQNIRLDPSYVNKPQLFPQKLISVSVDSALFAGPKESFANLNSITLSPIDFSKINLLSNSFSVDILSPEGLVNIGNEKAVDISFELKGYVEKWITLSEISPTNIPVGTKAEVYNDSLTVLVVGPAADVAGITAADLTAQVNLSGVDSSLGTVTVPVNVSINGNNSCWIYGSYRTSVNFTKD